MGGALPAPAVEATRKHIVEAAFPPLEELGGRIVFPVVLLHDHWRDREGGFAFPRYVGVREMEFY